MNERTVTAMQMDAARRWWRVHAFADVTIAFVIFRDGLHAVTSTKSRCCLPTVSPFFDSKGRAV